MDEEKSKRTLLRRRALRQLGWKWYKGDHQWGYDDGRIHAFDPFQPDYYADLLQGQMLEWLLARRIPFQIYPQKDGSVCLELASEIVYQAPTLLEALTQAVGGTSRYVSDQGEAT